MDPETTSILDHDSDDHLPTADLDRIERVLGSVEEALARLDRGDYGTCQHCGSPIDATTLVAMPTATRCEACSAGSTITGDGQSSIRAQPHPH